MAEIHELKGRVVEFPGSPWRLQTIYRTNLQSAYMQGRWQQMVTNAKAAPWWRYVAILDGRTRPTHKALAGRVFRYDDPLWQTHFPPCGFNCRCRAVALTDRDLARLGQEASWREHLDLTICVNHAGSESD